MSDDGRGPITVFLLDDHEIVRRGVADVLESDPDIRVIGEGKNAAEAQKWSRTWSPARGTRGSQTTTRCGAFSRATDSERPARASGRAKKTTVRRFTIYAAYDSNSRANAGE